MAERCEVLVVGGGVIGACCALELAGAGAGVTLVERHDPPAPDSGVYSNAGLITPSDPFPLASPGSLGKGMKWLLDSGSPFYVAPLADADLPRWLSLFAQYAREAPMRRAMPVQRGLLRAGADLHEEWAAQIGEACGYHHNGWLWLYETPQELAAGDAEIADTGPLGVVSEMVDAERLNELAPGVAAGFAGGRFQPEDAHVDPLAFVREVVRLAREKGAELRPQTEVLRLDTDGDRVTRVVTTRGDFFAETVVLAAGAWSAALARQVGLRLPVQPAKGYSVTIPRPEGAPDFPLYIGGRHVCVTPLGDRLRFAGTLEMTGFDLSVRWKRVQRIRDGGEIAFPGSAAVEPLEVWRGLRPCTPDGLPIIGRSPRHTNLMIATGHCMFGLGEGPITGRLVAQMVIGEPPQLDLTPFRVDRFPSPTRSLQDAIDRTFGPKLPGG